MSDFLLELLSEEIPARMQAKACKDLASLFETELQKAGLAAQAIETYATSRRLALIARNLPAETEAVREETKGPRSSAPPQALEGFLRKTGLSRDQLVDRDGVFFAVVEKPGRSTKHVLHNAIQAIVWNFPWPKSMRWGESSISTSSVRWVRPLQGVVALFGDELLQGEVAGVKSGAATVGHRFHHPGIITIGSAGDYAEKLRACRVIIDPAERRQIIRDGAAAAAAAAGLSVVPDEGLVAENAGLTEWPVPLLGSFDPAFLEVPREVIQLTMRTNQKYFACTDAAGNLAPNFICTANIDAADGGAAIVEGNQKVLAARLSDAKFFWEQDLKVPLEEQAKKLSQIVFHEKLGTVADKVERVAKLAGWLVEEGIVKPSPLQGRGLGEGESSASPAVSVQSTHPLSPALSPEGEREALAHLAETAARLAKADLVTGMVGEFPELQGIIGGYLARAQGHPPEVADAIRDHYKPVGQGDEVPTAPVTVAVSLADKLDTLASFFHTFVQLEPSGSKDPFALRRAALAIIAILIEGGVRLSIRQFAHFHEPAVMEAVKAADLAAKRRANPGGDIMQAFGVVGDPAEGKLATSLEQFFADRLKVQQREAGVRHDLIDAVFALGGEDDLVRLLARVRALQAFVETPEGTDLLAGYKRAANILKKEGYTPLPARREGLGVGQPGPGSPAAGAEGESPTPDPSLGAGRGEEKTLSYTPLPEEAQLIAALDSAEPRARAAVEAEDFEGAMAALASLRAPVDAFFDKVTVNDPDPDKRAARLNLLSRMRDGVSQVADFSRIEG